MSTQLPAHLLALFSAVPELTKVGENIHNEAFAKIRYSGKKWTLISTNGEEEMLTQTTFDAAGKPAGAVPVGNLDIIVVDANEHKSHTVYEKAWDPKAEPEAPVWSSDDGTPVPAEYESMVVSDYRRVAVLVANNPGAGIFELRVSAASITNFDRYNTTIRNNGVPIGALVTRITFDDAFDYPKLIFTPVEYINEEQAAAMQKVSTTGKQSVALAIGKKPQQAALPAPAAQPALAAPVGDNLSGVQVPVPEEKKAPARKAKAAAPVVMPTVAVPAAPVTEAAKVVTSPAPTNSQLDDLLNDIMNAGK